MTNLTYVVYYYYDHKVGVVGVLCPRVKIGLSDSLGKEAQPGQAKQMFGGGLRRRSVAPVVATDKANELASRALLSNAFRQTCFYRIFVLLDWGGQYLSSLIKCVGAKCTRRCCRVQLR